MIRVWIDGQQRDGIDEGWIARVVGEIRRDGREPCVRVTAKSSEVDVTLQAGQCDSGGGGGRPPKPREQEVFAIWESCQVAQATDFPIGQLIQCIKRVERAL